MKKNILYIVITVAMVTFGALDFKIFTIYFIVQVLLTKLLNSKFIT